MQNIQFPGFLIGRACGLELQDMRALSGHSPEILAHPLFRKCVSRGAAKLSGLIKNNLIQGLEACSLALSFSESSASQRPIAFPHY